MNKVWFFAVIAIAALAGCSQEPIDSLNGYKLGESYNDILYRKGFPTAGGDGVTLNYGSDDLVFHDGSLYLIDHTCQKGDDSKLAGVPCWATEADVKSKLGKDHEYLCHPNNALARVITSKKRGVYFILLEAKVWNFGVSNFALSYNSWFEYRGYIPNNPGWVPCK